MPGFNPGFGLGGGFATLVWVVAIVVVGGVMWRERKGFVSGTPIVLKTFRVNEDPNAAIAVEIIGRAAGILSWILNLLRLEQDYELIVTSAEVSVRRGSLSGIVHTYIPLNKITATVCGYQRSIWAFSLAVLFAIGFVLSLLSGFLENNRSEVGADMGMAFGLLILAAICALVYFLSKRIGIQIETMHAHGTVFKRSVIENVSVDLPQALQAIAVINARVLASQSSNVVPTQSAAQAPTSRAIPTPTTASAPGRCPKCAAVNPSGTRFCENCGTALAG